MHGEKARWELHKNATCCFEQILEATPNKTAAVQPLTSHLKGHSRHVGHCCRIKDKLISNILQWIPTYGHASDSQQARTHLHQLCVDTGCSLEDLPGQIRTEREKCWSDFLEKSVLSAWLYVCLYLHLLYNCCLTVFAQLYDYKYSYLIQIIVRFQWNTNNYIVSSNYFYLILVICLHCYMVSSN